jgi:SEL1 protein
MDFAFKLGKIYYQGSLYPSAGGTASGAEGVGRVPRNFPEARRYLLRVARAAWPHDPANPLDYRPSPPPQDRNERKKVAWAGAAASLIGRMYLRGEGFKQDAAVAKMWFERGVEFGDREAYNGLGIIWRDGLVRGKVDIQKAINYFREAANAELAEAQVNLGKILFGK